MNRKPFLLLSMLGLALATGCSTIRDLAGIENPEYSIREVRPNLSLAFPLSASSIDFDILMEVQNPNSVGLTLDRIDFDLFVDRQRVVRGYANDGIRIPASGRGDVRLRARVGYNEVRSLWNELVEVARGDTPQYEVRGTARYNTPLGNFDLPFNVVRSAR